MKVIILLLLVFFSLHFKAHANTNNLAYCSPGSVGKVGGFYHPSARKCYEGAIVLINQQYCSIGNKGRGEFYSPKNIPKNATCTSTGTTLQAKGISEMSGDVSILRNGKEVTLKQGSQIIEGDKISTGVTGKLNFQFDDGTKIKVGSGSHLVVDTAKFQPNCEIMDDPDNCSYGLTLLQGSGDG